MANIVDELVLQLGLDASKFDKAQKKTIDNLRKMENTQRKGSKENQKRLKETTEGYNKLRDAVVEFGTALAGVNGFKDFISSTVKGNASLGRQSQLLGMSARSLSSWGYAAEKFGGSQQGVVDSLQNMEGAWAKFRLGMGGTDFQTAMARLGLHGPQDFKNFATLSSHLMAVKRMYGEQAALASANALGIDKHTFLMLMQGPQKVRELYEKAYRLNGVTGQNVREAQLLWEKWVDLKEVFAADGQVIFHDLVPALGALMTDAEDLLHAFTRVDKATDGWAGKILALGAAIMTLRAPFALLKSGAGLLGAKGAAEGAEAAASGGILGKAFGWLGVAGRLGVIGLLANAGLDMVDPKDKAGSWIDQHVWGASWLDNEASKIGLGRSYAQQRAAAMGSTSTGSGGSLPRGLRNNNPGNIRYGKFARAHGATGADSSGFAIFPTLRAGERAMAALLQDYKARGIDTIAGIVSRYAPSSENNTGAYIASVSSQTGIGANTPLSASQYAAVQRAMMIQENGGAYARMLGPGATAPVVASGGHTSVETNIGSIHVNAPNATDADGVAVGMKKALAYNTLISGGMVGVT